MKEPDFRIIDLLPDNEEHIRQTASLVVNSFRVHSPNAWPDMKSALKEVQESFQEGRISRIAIDENNKVIGWIGGIRQYQGHSWELHPLVVDERYRGTGVGGQLVKDLEKRVKERGGTTIYIGTDDEDYMTTVSGIDLYPDVLEHLKNIKNIKGHPYEFYQKQGFSIVGVIPDANGPGKPDIFMAKRVGD